MDLEVKAHLEDDNLVEEIDIEADENPGARNLIEDIDAALTKMEDLATERVMALRAMTREQAKFKHQFRFMEGFLSTGRELTPKICGAINYASLDPNPLVLAAAEEDYKFANESYEKAKAEYDELISRLDDTARAEYSTKKGHRYSFA